VAKLIDEQVVGVGGQGFFVALQRAVAGDAVAVSCMRRVTVTRSPALLGGLVEDLRMRRIPRR
jgi:hypothetical protein